MTITPNPGERFRRRELSSQLVSLANLLLEAELPVPRFDRTPLLELHLRTEAEVDRVAAAIGTTPKRFGPEYFTGIENAELRVRWTAQADSGLAYSRPADGDGPQHVGAREPLHTGVVTEAGLVDETDPEIHVAFGHENTTQCGLAVADLPPGHSHVPSWSHVSTCMACADEAPF